MKFWTIFALLVAAAVGSSAEAATSDEGTPAETSRCPLNGTHYLPNPADCGSFYICIDGHDALINCPNGFEYNANFSACAEADGSCQVTTNVPSSTPPTEGVVCPSNGTHYLPNPFDCGSFYICIDGSSALIDCPAGYEFDANVSACVVENGACRLSTGAPPTTPSPGPNCPSNGTSFFPNLNDCASFFVCIEGDSALVQCPDGYLYNENLGSCTVPEESTCPSYISTTGSWTTQGGSSTTWRPTTGDWTTQGGSSSSQRPSTTWRPTTDDWTTQRTTTDDWTTQGGSSSTQRPTTDDWTTQEWSSTTVRFSSTTEEPDFSTTPSPLPECPTGSSSQTMFPNPDDCGSYYVCDNGQPILRPCPPGLHFNPVNHICDMPAAAGCEESRR